MFQILTQNCFAVRLDDYEIGERVDCREGTDTHRHEHGVGTDVNVHQGNREHDGDWDVHQDNRNDRLNYEGVEQLGLYPFVSLRGSHFYKVGHTSVAFEAEVWHRRMESGNGWSLISSHE